MTIAVKYYTSGMTGAPVLSNNWGDLISVLDACLVNGFNLHAVDSITSASGIATATVSAGHGYQPGQVIEIAGADQVEYNGQFVVITSTTTTFSYAITGTPVSPATTVAGITSKVASLGWTKAYAGTNKAAYKSSNVTATGNLLRIDDDIKGLDTTGVAYGTTWAKWANVGICRSMTDINTIQGAQAPYDPSAPNKNWASVQASQWGWYKWYHARLLSFSAYESTGDGGVGARNWVLVGDDRLFYLLTTFELSGNYSRALYCFGDIIPFKPGDSYATVLSATDLLLGNSNYLGYPNYNYSKSIYLGFNRTLNMDGNVLLRSHTGLGNPVNWGITTLNTSNSIQSSGLDKIPFPNGSDYSLLLLPSYIMQSDYTLRGMLPGCYWVPHTKPYSDLTIIDNVVGQTGKKFMLVNISDNNTIGQIGFDITGSWR